MFNLFSRKRKLGKPYWVRTSEISIKPEFLKTQIRPEKYQRKKQYYLDHGDFESKVYLSEDNVLQDGYSTYLIAQEFNLGKIEVYYGRY